MGSSAVYDEKRVEVLVVDDDEVFRKRLCRALRERCFAVHEASCAEDACRAAAQTVPQAAIIDLKMPDHSGLWLLERLLETKPDMSVLLLTGYGTISTAVKALRMGARNYLTKPTDADSILAALGYGHNTPRIEAPTCRTAELVPRPSLSQVEWDYIQRVLEESHGNVSRASKVLGLHRRSLQRKLAKMPPRLK